MSWKCPQGGWGCRGQLRAMAGSVGMRCPGQQRSRGAVSPWCVPTVGISLQGRMVVGLRDGDSWIRTTFHGAKSDRARRCWSQELAQQDVCGGIWGCLAPPVLEQDMEEPRWFPGDTAQGCSVPNTHPLPLPRPKPVAEPAPGVRLAALASPSPSPHVHQGTRPLQCTCSHCHPDTSPLAPAVLGPQWPVLLPSYLAPSALLFPRA